MKPHRTAIAWFRRDLRLADNPALLHAIEHARTVVPVFIDSTAEEGEWAPGAASRWWLHHSLSALDSELRKRGSQLIIRQGKALSVLTTLLAETGATMVSWNRLYEPAVIARDTRTKAQLAESGIEADSHNAALLFEPWSIQNAQRQPYRVFTPFWRAALARMHELPAPLRAPRRIAAPGSWPSSLPVAALDLLPRIEWDAGLEERWQPGEAGAHRQLKRFSRSAGDYRTRRDQPGTDGTSLLSPHLHFGEIGPRQVFAQLQLQSPRSESLATYARELGWREFAHQLLYHFPHTPTRPLDVRFEHWQWRRNRKQLTAWQRGLTGYPIVDAGMRELWHTGWMHNRVRMIVASFLTKNLLMDWQSGARWFWDTLVDADLANNTLGWQWTAGCGADAAPYYRIFNPVLQAEKFDGDRSYLRRWLPELAALPDKWIHQPWSAPDEILSAAGVMLGDTYPEPIVDLQESRNAALSAYQDTKTP